MTRRSPKPTTPTEAAWLSLVLDTEAKAITNLKAQLGPSFFEAVAALDACRGRVIVTAMGKPGFIAQKLSATLASIGVASFFLHPAEAAHGDIGRVVSGDVVVALSNSGSTEELVRLLVPLGRVGVHLVVVTGDANSPLAKAAHTLIDIGAIDEACPIGLVPTASSAALHAVSDALAMTLSFRRGFSKSDYARLHPGGKLGRAALRVSELMRSGNATPLVKTSAKLSQVVVVMTNTPGRPGAALVVDAKGVLRGIFTDGDLRRMAERGVLDFSARVDAVMSKKPRVISPDEYVHTASQVMREAKLDQLPVVDSAGKPVGLLDVQDLLAARLV